VQVNANPRMFVGVPGNNQTVGSSFFIGGCLRHVYVHSSVAGTFNNVQVVRVTVR